MQKAVLKNLFSSYIKNFNFHAFIFQREKKK